MFPLPPAMPPSYWLSVTTTMLLPGAPPPVEPDGAGVVGAHPAWKRSEVTSPMNLKPARPPAWSLESRTDRGKHLLMTPSHFLPSPFSILRSAFFLSVVGHFVFCQHLGQNFGQQPDTATTARDRRLVSLEGNAGIIQVHKWLPLKPRWGFVNCTEYYTFNVRLSTLTGSLPAR
jgi:hypothetical protein